MPTYVYHCGQCDIDFEAVRRFSDPPLESCPQGHGTIQRIFTPAGIIFKGSGWYVNDSKNGTSDGSAAQGDGESDKAEAKSESESESKSKSDSKEGAASKSDAPSTASETKPSKAKPSKEATPSA